MASVRVRMMIVHIVFELVVCSMWVGVVASLDVFNRARKAVTDVMLFIERHAVSGGSIRIPSGRVVRRRVRLAASPPDRAHVHSLLI